MNLGTTQKTQVKTSESGAYSVLSLEPVLYSVAVEAEGFRKEVVESVKVDTATTLRVNVTLEAGTVSTQLTVSAEVPQVNTESGATSSTVNEREIQDVPLVNRRKLSGLPRTWVARALTGGPSQASWTSRETYPTAAGAPC